MLRGDADAARPQPVGAFCGIYHFYWNDKMALEQALLVATSRPIVLADLTRRAKAEGEAKKFGEFENALSDT